MEEKKAMEEKDAMEEKEAMEEGGGEQAEEPVEKQKEEKGQSSGGVLASWWDKLTKAEKKKKKNVKQDEVKNEEGEVKKEVKEDVAKNEAAAKLLTALAVTKMFLGVLVIMAAVILLVISCNGLRECDTRRYIIYSLRTPISMGEGIVAGSLYVLLGGLVIAAVTKKTAPKKPVVIIYIMVMLVCLCYAVANSIQLGAVANDAPSSTASKVDYPSQRASMLAALATQLVAHMLVGLAALLGLLAAVTKL